MNPIPEFPGDLVLRLAGGPDLDALLAPVSPEAPCGPPIRHDALFTEIRLLREEDDPSLPMRQWERPLKRADWPRIESLCSAALAGRSKDLQLAAWLAESWTRQRGFAGLGDGLRLVEALLRCYWTGLHPVIADDGDSDARLAPLEWINGSLSASARVHAPLFRLDGDKVLAVTLALWERVAMLEMAPPEPSERGKAAAAPPSLLPARAELQAAAERLRPALARTAVDVSGGLAVLRSLSAFLHERLGGDAPSLGKLEETLESVERLLAQLLPEQAWSSPGTVQTAAPPEEGGALSPEPDSDDVRPVLQAAPALAVNGALWRNRREAYSTLEALADYLSEVEPHSPTPFLIRRAAKWGRMSLPEVIAEIIREEGDVSRLFQILGMKPAGG